MNTKLYSIRKGVGMAFLLLCFLACKNEPKTKDNLSPLTAEAVTISAERQSAIVVFLQEKILAHYAWDVKEQAFQLEQQTAIQWTKKASIGAYQNYNIQDKVLVLNNTDSLYLTDAIAIPSTNHTFLVVPSKRNTQGQFKPCVLCPIYEKEKYFAVERAWSRLFPND